MCENKLGSVSSKACFTMHLSIHTGSGEASPKQCTSTSAPTHLFGECFLSTVPLLSFVCVLGWLFPNTVSADLECYLPPVDSCFPQTLPCESDSAWPDSSFHFKPGWEWHQQIKKSHWLFWPVLALGSFFDVHSLTLNSHTTLHWSKLSPLSKLPLHPLWPEASQVRVPGSLPNALIPVVLSWAPLPHCQHSHRLDGVLEQTLGGWNTKLGQVW